MNSSSDIPISTFAKYFEVIATSVSGENYSY